MLLNKILDIFGERYMIARQIQQLHPTSLNVKRYKRNITESSTCVQYIQGVKKEWNKKVIICIPQEVESKVCVPFLVNNIFGDIIFFQTDMRRWGGDFILFYGNLYRVRSNFKVFWKCEKLH